MTANGPQPSPRIAQKRARVHAEVVNAALEILTEQGVDGLTLSAVADRLDYTKPALYHYFSSKEDLVRSVVLSVLHGEAEHLVAAVGADVKRDNVLGTLVHAFYEHYRPRLHAYRLVYCKFQLMDLGALGVNKELIRSDINPSSNRVIDAVVGVLCDGDAQPAPERARALAFSAWLAAVGLLNMLGTSEASDDPLLHSDTVLLRTIADAFDSAAQRL